MVRFRMIKIIKLLEHDKYDKVLALYKTKPRYRKAFNNLEKKKVIESTYGNDHLSEFVLNEFNLAIYEYELEGAFIAHFEGFCWGVAAAVAAGQLLQ